MNIIKQKKELMPDIWPAVVDVIIASLMILILLQIIQYIMFYMDDAILRMAIKARQNRMVTLIRDAEDKGILPPRTVKIETSGDYQKLRFSSELLFPVGKAHIPENETQKFEFLDAVGKIIKSAYQKEKLFDQIFIEGHTDAIPISNITFSSNWDLSTARAVFVVKYFIKTGILKPKFSSKKFIGAAGYGKYNNIKSNLTQSGRSVNRRIEIMLVYFPRNK